MMSLAEHESELLKAEQDISDAEHRVTSQALLVERLRSAGHQTAQAEELLLSMRGLTALLHDHRVLILQGIAALREGRKT